MLLQKVHARKGDAQVSNDMPPRDATIEAALAKSSGARLPPKRSFCVVVAAAEATGRLARATTWARTDSA
eukprot:5796489-Alexandrium_andersonii.AAC.1